VKTPFSILRSTSSNARWLLVKFREEVVQLNQHRRGQQQLASGSQQLGAGGVVAVAWRYRRIEHAGVDDHRWP
jgi:hypothetical protein